jgi:putative transposase
MRDTTLEESLLEELSLNGFNGLTRCMEILINEAMRVERSKALGASPYERTDQRQGYANGYKPKTIHTRSGKILLDIPQVRGIEFYPSCIEKGTRSEKALKCALAQMYISGVSTRKVKEITEVLCGFEVSSSQVSKATKELDEEFSKFRNRQLSGHYRYVYLDAKYIKVREDQQVTSQVLLIAIGVNDKGYREVLGVSVKSSEAYQNWKEFLTELKEERNLTQVDMFISDDHSGMKQARTEVYPNVPWQRCQFHFAQNAQSKATSKTQKGEIGEDIRSIFQQTDREAAERKTQELIQKWQKKNNTFATWIETDIHECFAVYKEPQAFHSKIRTSNGLERTVREIQRRTGIVGIFPNTESLLRLATAVLIEIHENWITADQPYMKFNNHSE